MSGTLLSRVLARVGDHMSLESRSSTRLPSKNSALTRQLDEVSRQPRPEKDARLAVVAGRTGKLRFEGGRGVVRWGERELVSISFLW